MKIRGVSSKGNLHLAPSKQVEILKYFVTCWSACYLFFSAQLIAETYCKGNSPDLIYNRDLAGKKEKNWLKLRSFWEIYSIQDIAIDIQQCSTAKLNLLWRAPTLGKKCPGFARHVDLLYAGEKGNEWQIILKKIRQPGMLCSPKDRIVWFVLILLLKIILVIKTYSRPGLKRVLDREEGRW